MNIQVIPDWQKSLKYYVMWGLIAIAASPEIYNYLVNQGVIDAQEVPLVFSGTIKALAIASGIGRIIKQTKDQLVADGTISDPSAKEGNDDDSYPL